MTRLESRQNVDVPDRGGVSESDDMDREFQNALGAALGFISYRPRSTREVDRKLSLKFSPEVIGRVTDWLLENKYLDDKRFAVQWKDYRDRLRPRSLRMIQRELSMMGVSEDIVNDLVNDVDEEENAYNAVIRFAYRKCHSGIDVDGVSRAIYPYLKRRGFDGSIIRSTMDRIAAELFS